jgi:hypothetical protein
MSGLDLVVVALREALAREHQKNADNRSIIRAQEEAIAELQAMVRALALGRATDPRPSATVLHLIH